MTERGQVRFIHLGVDGVSRSETAPNWDFLNRVSSVVDPSWEVGDGCEIGGNRRYRYCLSTGQCDTYVGNIFSKAIGTGATDVGIDWSALAESAAIGDISVVMTAPSTRAITANELRGGLITLNPSSGTNNDVIQHRLVTGNTACAASGSCTIYLDRSLVRALTGGTAYGYVYPSPYRAVEGAQVGSYPGRASFVGYAAAPVSTSGLYHWEQVRGQISCSLYGSAVGETQYMRDVVFRYDGNLIHRGATGATGLEAQRAGYIMDQNQADNGATVIMLQLE